MQTKTYAADMREIACDHALAHAFDGASAFARGV